MLIALTDQQKKEERNAIVFDLFKNESANIKNIVSSLSIDDKQKLLDKIKGHSDFFERIANEKTEVSSFRIEIAKFRINYLYPSLIKAINNGE